MTPFVGKLEMTSRFEIVCEVEYLEITKSTNKMRAPSFKGLRPDKEPEDCVLERPQKGS